VGGVKQEGEEEGEEKKDLFSWTKRCPGGKEKAEAKEGADVKGGNGEKEGEEAPRGGEETKVGSVEFVVGRSLRMSLMS